jgi:hypothetical protein
MMNGLQTLENWREYFGNPTGGTLGLFNAIQVSEVECTRTSTDWQNIGTVVALPVAPLLNDRLGRRWTLFIGSAGKSLYYQSRPQLTVSVYCWMCHSDCFSEHGHVYWSTSLDGCRKRLGLYRLPCTHHRTRFPHSTSSVHIPLQLDLVPWINRGGMDDFWDFPNPQHLVLADPLPHPGCTPSHPIMLDPLLPRIPSMVSRPRPR